MQIATKRLNTSDSLTSVAPRKIVGSGTPTIRNQWLRRRPRICDGGKARPAQRSIVENSAIGLHAAYTVGVALTD